MSARGGSASRPLAARSAAAAKGWASRKARANATAAMAPSEIAQLRGTEADRVLQGRDIRGLIDRTIASLRARDAE